MGKEQSINPTGKVWLERETPGHRREGDRLQVVPREGAGNVPRSWLGNQNITSSGSSGGCRCPCGTHESPDIPPSWLADKLPWG